MAFPTGAVTTDNLDNVSDSPASARADLLLAVQKLNDIIASYDSADGIAALDSGGLIVNTKLPTALVSASGNITLTPASKITKLSNILELTPQTVTQLNAQSGLVEGQVAYCSNGAAGSKCLAVYNGSAWKRVDISATTIAAS